MMLRTAAIFAVAWAALLAVLVSRHSESGCRMAFMRPGYIPHTENVASQHAQTYGLYLYRDGRWNGMNEITPDGVPVLFIPGNAGSYKQARSIAAEMGRQYRMFNDESPTSDEISSLDLWTVDTNEELSAFSADLVRRQAEYCLSAIQYILSQYTHQQQPPESVIVVAHSMGGIVAREILHLPSYREGMIQLTVSLSSPHAMPPAPFSRAMSSVYAQDVGQNTHIAISGGSADSLLPSDSTFISQSNHSLTVMSTAIPGVWAPISHQAIVWCDQLRRIIAKGVLLSVDSSASSKTKSADQVLSIWNHLLTGKSKEQDTTSSFSVDVNATVSIGAYASQDVGSDRQAWSLGQPPPRWVTGGNPVTFRLLTSLAPVYDFEEVEWRKQAIQVLACERVSPLERCRRLPVRDSRILPYLNRGLEWLPARHGVDEDRTMYLVDVETDTLADKENVVVLKDTTKDSGRRHWLTSQYAPSDEEIVIDASLTRMLFSGVDLIKDDGSMMALKRRFRLANAPSTSLLVYQVNAQPSPCATSSFNSKELFQPMLRHVIETQKGIEELNYPNLNGNINIDSHLSLSPYLAANTNDRPDGLLLEVLADSFASESCFPLQRVTIRVDVLSSISKWGTRYRSALVGFALGIWSTALWRQVRLLDNLGTTSSFSKCLTNTVPRELLLLSVILICSVLASSYHLLSVQYFAGLSDLKLWFVGPILLLASLGLVSASYVAVAFTTSLLNLARVRLPQFSVSGRMVAGTTIATTMCALLLPQQVILSFISLLALLAGAHAPLALTMKTLTVLLSPFYVPTTLIWLRDPSVIPPGLDLENHNPLLVIPFALVLLLTLSDKAPRRFEVSDKRVYLESASFFAFALASMAFSGRYTRIVFETLCILMAILAYTRYSQL